MDLIKKFMKIGGFKTPDELEAYGEDRFFNDFPEARQYAMGGHIKAQDGLWFQDPNKQALYDAETRYVEANLRGPNNNPDAAKAYGDILAMDPSATDIRQKVDSLNNVYPYYSSSFQVVPFKGGYGKYGNRTNQGWEATQELYNKEKQKPSIIPMDFSEPNWKGAVKKALGGMPEAYPQIATFDQAFSYGVPPGPQYLSHGGSAYPQAQTEQQFFIPIYTDVYNPYNKAMGGSNVEMYPNAKTTPHWGPSNVFFQEGGQEDGQELDRVGTLNRIGSFVNNIKTTAAKANAKNAMMGAVGNGGMAKYGKQLNTYQDKGEVKETPSYLTKADLDTWWKGVNQPQTPYYPGYYPQYPYAQYPAYNVAPQGNMGQFLNNYFAYTTGSPYPGATTRGRVSVDGQRAGKFYGNMPLIKAMMPELYGKGNFADMMTNNADFRNRAEAMGLTSYKDGLFRDEYTFNQRVPWEAPTVTLGPKPTAPQNTTSMSVKDLINTIDKMPTQQGYNPTPTSASSASQPAAASSPSSVNPDADYITNSKYPDLDQPFAGTNMTQRERLLQQLNSSDPKEVEYAKYRIGAMTDWDAMQGSTTTTSNPAANTKISTGPTTTTTSQAPSNASSMDPNVAAKKAAMQSPPVNQAYIDAQKAVPSFPTEAYNQFMPQMPDMAGAPNTAGPREGFGYGGYTGYKFGGSYRQGDVVYMSDDEIAEFIRNGGQIEEME